MKRCSKEERIQLERTTAKKINSFWFENMFQVFHSFQSKGFQVAKLCGVCEIFYNTILKPLILILLPFDGVSKNSIYMMDAQLLRIIVLSTTQKKQWMQLKTLGALLHFLPLYSPDIEKCIFKFKICNEKYGITDASFGRHSYNSLCYLLIYIFK